MITIQKKSVNQPSIEIICVEAVKWLKHAGQYALRIMGENHRYTVYTVYSI